MKLSLRLKGIIVFSIAVAYLVAVAAYISHERSQLIETLKQMEIAHAKLQLLVRANSVLENSIGQIQFDLNQPKSDSEYQRVTGGIEPVITDMRFLANLYPAFLAEDTQNLVVMAHLLKYKHSRTNLVKIRDSEISLLGTLNKILTALSREGNILSTSYQQESHSVPLISLFLYLTGAIIFGAIVIIFLSRLTSDVKRLEDRAMDVAAGYRGDPLPVTRKDEIGGLMIAINAMQKVLRATESKHEILRQQRFHQEKMAALGSMASAIVHEVSNPMAAIAGIANCIVDSTPVQSDTERRKNYMMVHEQAEMILNQTQRIGDIMHQMTTLTNRSSNLPELLDINDLVNTTCRFVAYDKRFNSIHFDLKLDPTISAVSAVEDHLTQILMNLLINAADAMEDQPPDKQAWIKITTFQDETHVVLEVADSGCGMSPETLSQVFAEYFTTKPAGKGRGIGLFLCKELIESEGGSIVMESTEGVGTTARVLLPLSSGNTETV